MALNPINILRKKKATGRARTGSSQSSRASQSPAVNASRAAMQKRRQEAEAAADTAVQNTTPGDRSNRAVNSVSEASGGSAGSAQAANQISPSEIIVPIHIGRYTMGGKLGSGTCGVVHKALDTVLDREVAIKLSPIGEPHLSTGKVPGAQRAYQTEIFAAGRLRHPNIVTVYDAGQYGDLNYLVMEAVQGKTLKHFGKGQKLLPLSRALEVVIDCCKALDYSHSRAILHRDIKPANIMIADNDSVKLLDFGIAVGLEDGMELSRKGPTLGTPNYMSPEQILGKALGPSSDLYSLGTVLFELVTGKQLFKAKKVKDLFRTVVHQEAPKVADFRPDLPAAFSLVVEKALRKKPASRYQSGAELIADLAPFLEDFKDRSDHTPEQLAFTRSCCKLDFFAGFVERDVLKVLDQSTVRDIDAGSELLEGGNIERRLLILADGIATEYESGRIKQLYTPGDCIGEAGFVQGSRVDAQCLTTTKVRVIELSAAALSELPAQLHLRVYKRVSGILVERMSDQHQTIQPHIAL